MHLSQQLKTATAPCHQQIETLLWSDQILQGQLDPAQYRQLILINHAAYSVTEPLILSWLDKKDHAFLEPAKRSRVRQLMADRADVGATEEFSRSLRQVTPTRLPHRTTSLGDLYVLEGATLGGRIIWKKLSACPLA